MNELQKKIDKNTPKPGTTGGVCYEPLFIGEYRPATSVLGCFDPTDCCGSATGKLPDGFIKTVKICLKATSTIFNYQLPLEKYVTEVPDKIPMTFSCITGVEAVSNYFNRTSVILSTFMLIVINTIM